MLTEKVDAFKALTGYVNTINRTPASEEGNEIDQFRRELGLDSASAVRGGSAGPADGDGDDDPEPFDADDDAGPEPSTAEAPPEPAPGVPGVGADPGGEASGSSFSAVRHSVRWDGGSRS